MVVDSFPKTVSLIERCDVRQIVSLEVAGPVIHREKLDRPRKSQGGDFGLVGNELNTPFCL